MKRFFLFVPTAYEEKVAKEISNLGLVQFSGSVLPEQLERTEQTELLKRFMILYERMNKLLAGYKPEKGLEQDIEQTLNINLDQLSSLVPRGEDDFDQAAKNINKIEAELEDLRAAHENINLLKQHGLEPNEIGNFKHIFVKAGFLNTTLIPRFDAYTTGTGILYVSERGRGRDTFVLASGMSKDKPFLENVMKLLNFQEITIPPNLPVDFEEALKAIGENIASREIEIQRAKEALLPMKKQLDNFRPLIEDILLLQEARSTVAHTASKSLFSGWIPSSQIRQFEAQIEKAVPDDQAHFKFEDPKPGDKVPIEIKHRWPLNSFAVFTTMLGTPNYFEIDPTPIFLVLYTLMFGMMFGDIGNGFVFVVLGLVLTRLRRGVFFSPSGTRKLGTILVLCGASAIVFGFLYGDFFLMEVMPPLLLSPLNDLSKIMEIALVFGVVQIMLSLVLNIFNKVRRHQRILAVLSGHGIVGLTYYSAGIVLALAFIQNMSFNVFLQQSLVLLTLVTIVSLALIFLSPVIKALVESKKQKLGEKLLEGFGEGLETFVTFISNSVSYIRLAAFAIAHAALGTAATLFASLIGIAPSFILMNVLAFVIEGFAALIQSLRLMYYEFSTKFYVGDGTPFRPFHRSSSTKKSLNS